VAIILCIKELPKYLSRIEFASMNNKPVFVLEVVTYKKAPDPKIEDFRVL